MLTVADIWPDANEILGDCDEVKVYRYVSDAIELLANKGEWDPLRGYVDICCSGRTVTLPTEVETPLAVLINGLPAVPNDALFAFHINGPGDTCDGWAPCQFTWMDQGLWPTYSDLPGPRKLWAVSTDVRDVGVSILIYGEDSTGSTLREDVPPIDGMLLPIQYGSSAMSPVAVNRILKVTKPVTKGRIKIYSSDYSNADCNNSGTIVSDMQYWETSPLYRRILLSQGARWARVYFRRATARVSKQTDLIPLHSRFGLVAMIQAINYYRKQQPDSGLMYESQAVRWMQEKEQALMPPGGFPIQVDVRGGLYNPATDDFGWD
jgi:hypothetical protein